jgi:hypothetical protein
MLNSLGSYIDELSIMNLKIHHSRDDNQISELVIQKAFLLSQIEKLVKNIEFDRNPSINLTYGVNKIFDKEKIPLENTKNSIAENIDLLTITNINIWKLQEDLINFEKIEEKDKNKVVSGIVKMNLQRNAYVDKINLLFYENNK